MKKIILLSIIAFIFTTSYSQTKKHYEKHSFGISAGMSHAFGLSYQYWGETIGLHTSLTPYTDFERNHFTAFSITPMFVIHEGKRAKYFMYEANGFALLFSDNEIGRVFMPAVGTGSKIWITENLNINIALGLGVLFGNENTGFQKFTMLPDANFGFYYSF